MKHCPEYLLSMQGRVDAQGNCRTFQRIRRSRGAQELEESINADVEGENNVVEDPYGSGRVAESGHKLLKNAFDVSSDGDDIDEEPVAAEHIAI